MRILYGGWIGDFQLYIYIDNVYSAVYTFLLSQSKYLTYTNYVNLHKLWDYIRICYSFPIKWVNYNVHIGTTRDVTLAHSLNNLLHKFWWLLDMNEKFSFVFFTLQGISLKKYKYIEKVDYRSLKCFSQCLSYTTCMSMTTIYYTIKLSYII